MILTPLSHNSWRDAHPRAMLERGPHGLFSTLNQGNIMTDLTGKTAIVTAGSNGIGLACAQALAEHGATVFVAARNEKEGEDAACGIRKQGGRAFFLRFDATRAEDYPRLIDTAARKD